jgi:hypothetical protein
VLHAEPIFCIVEVNWAVRLKEINPMANIIVTAHSLSLRLVRMTLKSSSSTREVYTIGAQETNGEDMMERGVDGQQYICLITLTCQNFRCYNLHRPR